MTRKRPRSLRNIKTSTGTRPAEFPPDSSAYSMRSHLRARDRAAGPNKSPYKARAIPPPSSLGVWKFYGSTPELTQDGEAINVFVSLPAAIAGIVQLDVQDDILIVWASNKDVQCHIECLLPFVAHLTGHSYADGVLRITLEKKYD